MFDRTERAGPGAAVVAADHDVIGVGFGDPGGDRPDARFGYQLDADARARVGVLEIEDQLRQVFNRVDIVVRRRRDQRHAGRRVARAGDDLIDLVAGKLAAFAGFRALRDLDLQFVGVDQIVARDAETRRTPPA